MARRNIWHKLIDKGGAATTVGFPTHLLENMMLVVDQVYDGVDSTFIMTVYSSNDIAGTVKTAIGFNPSLSATRDSDGAITFTTSTTVAYEIPGVHPFIFIDIGTVTAAPVINLWLGGTEDY